MALVSSPVDRTGVTVDVFIQALCLIILMVKIFITPSDQCMRCQEMTALGTQMVLNHDSNSPGQEYFQSIVYFKIIFI